MRAARALIIFGIFTAILVTTSMVKMPAIGGEDEDEDEAKEKKVLDKCPKELKPVVAQYKSIELQRLIISKLKIFPCDNGVTESEAIDFLLDLHNDDISLWLATTDESDALKTSTSSEFITMSTHQPKSSDIAYS